MTTKYAINYALDTTTSNNAFSALWKLTRCMKAAGWTYKASGDGSNKDTTGTAANDKWGGNADPMLDVYAGAIQTQLDSRSAWWCAEGPVTVKLGIGGASTGTFLRGETVTQATSGVTGEVIGYVLNAAGNSGWMVILPQTGTFDGTHGLTGGTSGATITPTSYNLVRRQLVFAKNTSVTSGWIFYEALTDTEIAASSNTALFSDLAANASNCTATTAPANSASTNNLFPSYAISCIGSGGGGSVATLFGTAGTYGKSQMAAVNASGSAGVSPDGSFFVTVWDVTNNAYRHIAFQRLDDTEPGDVDPFAFVSITTESSASGTAGRTAGSSSSAAPTIANSWSLSCTVAKGYCARATGTMGTGIDSYTPFQFGLVANNNNAVPAQAVNAASVPKIRNHPDNAGTPPYPIEGMSVYSAVTNLTMRKGICRWLVAVPTGAQNDTADSKSWLIIFPASSTTNSSFAFGPLDGSTIPVTT